MVATYSNTNKTTAGSYSLKSFSLAAYKGQTIRVQFRNTMDSSVTTTFRIDDVSLKLFCRLLRGLLAPSAV